VACADVATTKAKATAINLIIVSSHVILQEDISLKVLYFYAPSTQESLIRVKDLIGEHAAE
jgi:hypothetical protein